MDSKRTMALLEEAVHHYDKLLNKEIHYVYKKNNKYHKLILKSAQGNFAHLFGIKYIDPKTRREFSSSSIYSSLKKKKLSPAGIQKKADGTTDQKLEVVPYFDQIMTCNLRVTGSGTYLNLHYDAAIRTNRSLFCMTLFCTDSGHFVPKSLLNLQSGKSNTIGSGYPVHCVYEISGNGEIVKFCEHEDFSLFIATYGYAY